MPTAPDETSVIEHEVTVEASPETVFAYFTDPVKLVRWFGTEATLDPRPGGACRITFTPTVVMLGEFVELVPSTRLVLRWGWERDLFTVSPASTLVEVSLRPDAEGTRVRVTHQRLPAAALDFHRTGWEHFLGRLARAAAGEDPGPSRWAGEPLGEPQ